jgi:peptide/nickel transport system permease protein
LGALTLALALIAAHSLGVLCRVYRRGLIEAERAPFMEVARAKGLEDSHALWRHGQRHALFALLSATRSEAAWAVGGSATMEVLFGLPGISQFLVESVAARDYFVLQAYVMIVAVWLLALNAGVELLAGWLDPRPT